MTMTNDHDILLPGPELSLFAIRAFWAQVGAGPDHPASRVLALSPYDPELSDRVRELVAHNVRRLAEIRARVDEVDEGMRESLLLEDAGLRLALHYGFFAADLDEGDLFAAAGVEDDGGVNHENFLRIGLHCPGEYV
jgi:hypothetical protein